jgi:hypothetical protein
MGDDQIAENRGDRETCDHDESHEGKPAPARFRRHELGHGRIADDDLGAETKSLDEPADDKLIHILRERGGKRSQAEDQQVDLICETPTHRVSDKAGDKRAERHADKSQRQELQILRQCGELGLYRRSQHPACDIQIVAVEEHPGADQPEYPIVKR